MYWWLGKLFTKWNREQQSVCPCPRSPVGAKHTHRPAADCTAGCGEIKHGRHRRTKMSLPTAAKANICTSVHLRWAFCSLWRTRSCQKHARLTVADVWVEKKRRESSRSRHGGGPVAWTNHPGQTLAHWAPVDTRAYCSVLPLTSSPRSAARFSPHTYQAAVNLQRTPIKQRRCFQLQIWFRFFGSHHTGNLQGCNLSSTTAQHLYCTPPPAGS